MEFTALKVVTALPEVGDNYHLYLLAAVSDDSVTYSAWYYKAGSWVELIYIAATTETE